MASAMTMGTLQLPSENVSLGLGRKAWITCAATIAEPHSDLMIVLAYRIMNGIGVTRAAGNNSRTNDKVANVNTFGISVHPTIVQLPAKHVLNAYTLSRTHSRSYELQW